jgi:hypothetical protein
MATYTQADLDAVKTAIIKLSTGQMPIMVVFGNKTVQRFSDLEQLRALLAVIEADVAAATGAHQSYRFAVTSKGA